MSDWGITAYYDSSWNGINFWTQSPAPIPSQGNRSAELAPVGGAPTLVNLGADVGRLDLTVACAYSEYDALRAALWDSATLEFPGWSGTARLTRISGTVHPHYTGIYSLTLSFVL